MNDFRVCSDLRLTINLGSTAGSDELVCRAMSGETVRARLWAFSSSGPSGGTVTQSDSLNISELPSGYARRYSSCHSQ